MSKLVLGVLGEGIAYSLSPRIFEWGFRQKGIQGEYRIFDLPPGQAREFLRSPVGWTGVNVTTPHKQLAYDVCSFRPEETVATGAVNTVVRGLHGLEGHNTDVAGFLCAVQRMSGVEFQPRSALVIGTGGAARAVLHALQAKYRYVKVDVVSRDPTRARTRLEPLLKVFPAHNCIGTEMAVQSLKTYDLVVQATPVGSARIHGSPLKSVLRFKPGASVMDLVYAPRRTSFLEQAERSGARTQNGLTMLIAQAADSFRIWTGVDFPLQRAMDELLPELTHA